MILFTPFDDGQIIQPRGGRTTVDVVQVRQSLYFFYFSTWWAMPPRLEGWPMQNTVFSSSFPQFLFFSCSTTRKLLAIVQKIKNLKKGYNRWGMEKRKKRSNRRRRKRVGSVPKGFRLPRRPHPFDFPTTPFIFFLPSISADVMEVASSGEVCRSSRELLCQQQKQPSNCFLLGTGLMQ